jgi:hypothetical protein
MLTRISVIALMVSSALHTPAAAAASDFEGRWIRACGNAVYCRIFLSSTGPSSFDIFFVQTQPSTKGTPLDTDANAPEPTICEWSSPMRYQAKKDTLTGKGGLTARVVNGKLSLTGISAKCAEPGPKATFDRDDADDFGDL